MREVVRVSKESTGKRITDELRVCARAFIGVWVDSVSQTITFTTSSVAPTVDSIRMDSSLLAIADRIDAAHEEALSQAYMDVSDSEWVRLPKDADGEPIHIGDKLVDKDDKLPKPAIVKCILYNDEGCVVSDIDPRGCWYDPSFLRHYAPTVEDLLHEFICDHEEGVRDEIDLIAEYAAKLRLAGSDAE